VSLTNGETVTFYATDPEVQKLLVNISRMGQILDELRDKYVLIELSEKEYVCEECLALYTLIDLLGGHEALAKGE
jgi:hypothetical protein